MRNSGGASCGSCTLVRGDDPVAEHHVLRAGLRGRRGQGARDGPGGDRHARQLGQRRPRRAAGPWPTRTATPARPSASASTRCARSTRPSASPPSPTAGSAAPRTSSAQVTDTAGGVLSARDGRGRRRAGHAGRRRQRRHLRRIEGVAEYSRRSLDDDRPVASKTGTAGPRTRTTPTPGWSATPRRSPRRSGWATTAPATRSSTPTGSIIYGSGLPGAIWQQFMNAVLDGTPEEDLPDRAAHRRRHRRGRPRADDHPGAADHDAGPADDDRGARRTTHRGPAGGDRPRRPPTTTRPGRRRPRRSATAAPGPHGPRAGTAGDRRPGAAATRRPSRSRHTERVSSARHGPVPGRPAGRRARAVRGHGGPGRAQVSGPPQVAAPPRPDRVVPTWTDPVVGAGQRGRRRAVGPARGHRAGAVLDPAADLPAVHRARAGAGLGQAGPVRGRQLDAAPSSTPTSATPTPSRCSACTAWTPASCPTWTPPWSTRCSPAASCALAAVLARGYDSPGRRASGCCPTVVPVQSYYVVTCLLLSRLRAAGHPGGASGWPAAGPGTRR